MSKHQSDRRVEKTAAQRLAKAREKVMGGWEKRVVSIVPSAQRQSKALLRNSLPRFLDRLVDALDANGIQADVNEVSEKHGIQRADLENYSLPDMLAEYRILREVLFEVLEAPTPVTRPERDILLASIEEGMTEASISFMEHARHQQQLAEARFAMATHASGVGVWELDLRNGQVWRSESHDRAYGFDGLLPEWTLEQAKKRFHPEDLKRFEKNLAQAIESRGTWDDEFRTIWPDGSTHWMWAAGQVVANESGEPIKIMGTNRDVTDVVKARQELDRLVNELRDERELRERFVATLTHDLRTPLAAAKMCAQRIEKKACFSEDVAQIHGRLMASIDRADRMILDLLDVCRIRSGETLPLAVQTCSLNDIAKKSLSELSVVHGDRFHLDAPVSITGTWSMDSIRRILENLSNNAIKYGAADRPVTVCLKTLGDEHVELSVHNWGNPISPADQARIFQPYRRTTSAKQGGKAGWGLGLSLVQGLAVAHGGFVAVQSSPDFGTVFRVTLPRHTGMTQAPHEKMTST